MVNARSKRLQMSELKVELEEMARVSWDEASWVPWLADFECPSCGELHGPVSPCAGEPTGEPGELVAA